MLDCFRTFILLIITNDVLHACKIDHGQPYIVGGTRAHPGEFPWQVSIQLRNQHTCGGAILNREWILTAAHCFEKNTSPNDYSVLAGTVKLDAGGVRSDVTKINIHQNFQPPITNDIALMKLASSLSWSDDIRPVSLAHIHTPADTQAIVSGWGYVDQSATVETNTLQKINLVTISNADCSTALSNEIPIGDMCTFTQAGEGICQGDSGGPLIDSSTSKQIGIVSANLPCAKGYPDVYTRVANYITWINSNQE